LRYGIVISKMSMIVLRLMRLPWQYGKMSSIDFQNIGDGLLTIRLSSSKSWRCFANMRLMFVALSR